MQYESASNSVSTGAHSDALGLAVADASSGLVFGAETASAKRGYTLGFFHTSSKSGDTSTDNYVTEFRYEDNGDGTTVTKTVTTGSDGSQTYDRETKTIAPDQAIIWAR